MHSIAVPILVTVTSVKLFGLEGAPAAVFLIITVVSGVVRMPKILDKLFVFVVLGLLAFICICLGYTIGLINIEGIFRV